MQQLETLTVGSFSLDSATVATGLLPTPPSDGDVSKTLTEQQKSANGHQHEGTQEEPTTQPVILTPELDEFNPGSSVTLPACESQPETSRQPIRVLLLSFLAYSEADILQQTTGCGISISFKHVNSITKYQQELDAFVTDSRCKGFSDLYVLHLLIANERNEPTVGGRVVSESQLLGPFNALCSDDQPTRFRVFQLTYQVPKQDLGSEVFSTVAVNQNDVERTACDYTYVRPRRASLSGSEVYQIAIPSDADLLKVHEGLGLAFAAMLFSGNEPKGDDLVRQIECHCNGSRLIRMSGIPDASAATRSDPPKALTVTHTNIPVVPEIPDEDHASENFQHLLNKSSEECGQTTPDIFVGYVVKHYEKGCGSNRIGAEKDVEHIRKAAQRLGCREEDIHLLWHEDGCVTKGDFLRHNERVLAKYKDKQCVRNVYVCVSAHGRKEGIKTSLYGEVIPLRELLAPLAQLGGFVLLLYQACRGSRHHSAEGVELERRPFIRGLGFCNPDTSGCCLPPEVPNCAAIFASTAGFVCYRNEDEGSWMLRSFGDVLEELASQQRGAVSVRQLAEMVQARLHAMKPDGEVLSGNSYNTYRCYMQIQYAVQSRTDVAVIQARQAASLSDFELLNC